jgi:hypothetical protein
MFLILQTFIRQGRRRRYYGAEGGDVTGEKNSENLGGIAGGIQYKRRIIGCINRNIDRQAPKWLIKPSIDRLRDGEVILADFRINKTIIWQALELIIETIIGRPQG